MGEVAEVEAALLVISRWENDVETACFGVYESHLEFRRFFGPNFIEAFGEQRSLDSLVVRHQHRHGYSIAPQLMNRVGKNLVANVVVVVFDEHEADLGSQFTGSADVLRIDGFDRPHYFIGLLLGAYSFDEHSEALPRRRSRFQAKVEAEGQ